MIYTGAKNILGHTHLQMCRLDWTRKTKQNNKKGDIYLKETLFTYNTAPKIDCYDFFKKIYSILLKNLTKK